MGLQVQLAFMAFLVLVCLLFLGGVVYLALSKPIQDVRAPVPTISKTTTTLIEYGSEPLQTTTTLDHTIPTTSTTIHTISENGTTSTTSSTISTTTTTQETVPQPQSFTVMGCDGQTIVTGIERVDCSQGYKCDGSNVSKTYETEAQMVYDACIPIAPDPVDPEEYSSCDDRQDDRKKELCYINLATDLKDIDACGRLTRENYRQVCIARVAVARVDFDLCYSVTNRSIRGQCQREVKLKLSILNS